MIAHDASTWEGERAVRLKEMHLYQAAVVELTAAVDHLLLRAAPSWKLTAANAALLRARSHLFATVSMFLEADAALTRIGER